jgi:DNA-binding NtrC family response regulator
MNKQILLVLCAAAATLHGASVAHACGDKLSVIGGGVSFDRVSQHRGNVVLLVEPNSSLRAANDELKLRQALEYAGNKVVTVETTAELTRVLGQGKTDVVLVSWDEAGKLQDQLASHAKSPTVLPVAYRTSPTELTAARKQGTCYARAEQRQDKQLVRTVGHVLEQREKNLPLDCRTAASTTST